MSVLPPHPQGATRITPSAAVQLTIRELSDRTSAVWAHCSAPNALIGPVTRTSVASDALIVRGAEPGYNAAAAAAAARSAQVR